jgi:hypothetical protein
MIAAPDLVNAVEIWLTDADVRVARRVLRLAVPQSTPERVSLAD